MSTFRRTKSVNELLAAFNQSEDAISVVDLVKRFDKKMNKTTVYRILERLEDAGQLHSFLGKDGLYWYARCKNCTSSQHTDLHPHFQCTECGKSECLEINITIPSIPDHSVENAQLLITGKCKACL